MLQNGKRVLLNSLPIKKENDGNVNVPVRYKTGDGFPLGKWVSHQRSHYKKNELDDDRIRRLDELGFVWGAR